MCLFEWLFKWDYPVLPSCSTFSEIIGKFHCVRFVDLKKEDAGSSSLSTIQSNKFTSPKEQNVGYARNRMSYFLIPHQRGYLLFIGNCTISVRSLQQENHFSKSLTSAPCLCLKINTVIRKNIVCSLLHRYTSSLVYLLRPCEIDLKACRQS